MRFFFLFIIFAYLAGNFYVWRQLCNAISSFPSALRIAVSVLFWLCALSFFAAMGLRHSGVPSLLHSVMFVTGASWMAFILYMVIALLPVSLAGKIFPGLNHGFLWALLPVLCLLAYGNCRYRHPDINRISVQLEKPLSCPEVKVVAVSDVHLGIGTGKKALKRYVDMINAENPDVIIIGGDLIDSSAEPLVRERMDEELTMLRAPMGIYMVPGNHEYISGISGCEAFLKDTPVVLLRDSVVSLPCGLQIIGRDDRFSAGRKNVAELLAFADTSKPVFLVDHQPYGLAENDALGIDVQFSGHTHGGQLWPGNLIVKKLYEQPDGWRKWENAFIYVSSGLSLWGPPFRIGTSSDMAVLTLSGK